VTGQNTKEFERIAWKMLTPASFSIWYDGYSHSINLVAKSVVEMKMWVEALQILQQKAIRGEDLSALRSLEVSVNYKDRNRPQTRKNSGPSLRSDKAAVKDVDPAAYRRVVGDLEALRVLFQQVKALAQNESVQKSSESSSINQILSELEERIEELQDEVANVRSTKIAKHDIWRTRVDIQALREKICVLAKENKRKFTKSNLW